MLYSRSDLNPARYREVKMSHVESGLAHNCYHSISLAPENSFPSFDSKV